MQFTDNKLSTVKKYFVKQVSSVYGEREAENMFRITISKLLDIEYSKTQLPTVLERRITESEALKFIACIKDLKAEIPIQYVLQEAWFYDLPLFVNEHVLIPRPETEELVQEAIAGLQEIPSPIVLDACTGSGCIALAIKNEIPNAVVKAFDVSNEALEVAKTNAENFSLSVEFYQDSLLNIEHTKQEGNSYHSILSNPPYIPEDELDTLGIGVLKNEPSLALFTPKNEALLFYKALKNLAKTTLKPSGFILMEVHEEYAEAVRTLFIEEQFLSSEILTDLQGKQRMVKAIMH